MRPHVLYHSSKVAILVIIFMAMVWQSKTSQAEDLMEIYTLARENDPAFQSQKYRHEASPETLKQAYSELLPKASASGYYQRTRQRIFFTDVAVFGTDRAHFPEKGFSLTLTQPLLEYSAIQRVLQAKQEVKLADLEFEASKQDLILRVAEAYIEALQAQDNLVFTRAEEEAVRLHFQLAQGRYNSGLAPITDFHDAKARLASVTALRVKAETRLDDALEALAELTGQSIKSLSQLKSISFSRDLFRQMSSGKDDQEKKRTNDQVEIRTEEATVAESSQEAEAEIGGEELQQRHGEMVLVSPDPDDVDQWVEAALKQNLEVEARRAAVSVAAREIERQRAGHWPSLKFVARLNRDEEGGSLFGGESDVETREAILQVDVPIFEGLFVLSKTREAIKLHAAAQQELEKEIRAVKRATKGAFLGVKSAIENTEALRQSVVSNGIALEAKREGFKSGLFPSLAVLDAERDLHKSKLEYAKAQYEYIINSLRLKKAVGTLSERDLAEVNQWLE